MPTISEEQAKACRLLREADQLLRRADNLPYKFETTGTSVTEPEKGTDSYYDTLWEAYANNGHDDTARNALVEAYMPFVRGIAMSYRHMHIPEDDRVSIGTLALIDAIERFEYNRGSKFVSYAAQRIRGAMLDADRKSGIFPKHSTDNTVLRIAMDIEKETRHAPSIEEIMTVLGTPKCADNIRRRRRKINRIMNQGKAPARIGAVDHESSDEMTNNAYHDYVPKDPSPEPPEIAEVNERKKHTLDVIAGLSLRERRIITLYYFEELNMKEIGKVLGITESRVCQMHSKLLKVLKDRTKPEYE